MTAWGKLVSENDKKELAGMGIYLVFANKRLIYIGWSKNLYNRLRMHDRISDFMDAGATSVTLIPYLEAARCEKEEIRFIQIHKPELNRQFYTNPRSLCNRLTKHA